MIFSDITNYKNKIANRICQTPDIIELLNNPKIDINDPTEINNVNLFSYMRIPNTAMSAKNYICFDVNAKSSNYNDLYKNITINMAVICHQSEIKTMWGNRHDVLGGVILETFNWSSVLGLELELISDTENILEREYHARTLQFRNLVLNSAKNGVKNNGVR